MGPSGKWIDGIDADGSVADAARRSLDARLATVNYWLPLAAYLAEQDIEHVHRLRVSTRRAVAAVRLYRDCLPPKLAQWMERRLKKIRQAAGDARDLDVLGLWLRSEYGERAAKVVTTIDKRRRAVQLAIVKIAERCRKGDRFVRKTAKLLAGIEASSEAANSVIFRDWAALRLADSSTEFFAALPHESADVASLHQFRIRAKALRYTIELIAPAFGRELRDDHYREVEALQERLGKIQDHVTASDMMEEWAAAADDSELQDALHELVAEERIRLAGEIRNFRAWWTVERVEQLKQALV